MNKLNRLALAFSLCMFTLLSIAQPINTQPAEPTDFMRSNGKIYVVVAVLVVIVAGLFIYLLNLDKKISRLEKNGRK